MVKKRKETGESSGVIRRWLPGLAVTLALVLVLSFLAALALRQEWLGQGALNLLPAVCLALANLTGCALTALRAESKRLPLALAQGAMIFALLLLANALFISEGFVLSEMAVGGVALLMSSLLGGMIGAARPHRRRKR